MNLHDRVAIAGIVLVIIAGLVMLLTPAGGEIPPHPPIGEPGAPRYTTTIDRDVYGTR